MFIILPKITIMNIDFRKLKNKRQWKATTGLSEAQFGFLSKAFSKAFVDIFGKTYEERQNDGPKKARFKTSDDLLFFLLFSLKTGLGQDSLGFILELDGSNVNRNKQLALRVLSAALIALKVMPKREFSSPEEFEEYFKEHGSIILDGTEQRIQRPGNQEVQKEYYSGKKKATP